MSPLEGPSTVRRSYDDTDDDDNDLYAFELVKNKIVSSIIVPENCVYVKLLLFHYIK